MSARHKLQEKMSLLSTKGPCIRGACPLRPWRLSSRQKGTLITACSTVYTTKIEMLSGAHGSCHLALKGLQVGSAMQTQSHIMNNKMCIALHRQTARPEEVYQNDQLWSLLLQPTVIPQFLYMYSTHNALGYLHLILYLTFQPRLLHLRVWRHLNGHPITA